MILVDTSGLLSALDPGQASHRESARVLRQSSAPRLLSPFVLAELDYLLTTRVSERTARMMLEQVAGGAYQLERFDVGDVDEAISVLERYDGLGLGLADASLVVIARRHGVRDILTLDQRHFRAVMGPGDKPFRILPADANAA